MDAENKHAQASNINSNCQYHAVESEHGWGVAREGRIILYEDGEQTAAEAIARILNQFVDEEDYLADFPKKPLKSSGPDSDEVIKETKTMRNENEKADGMKKASERAARIREARENTIARRAN